MKLNRLKKRLYGIILACIFHVPVAHAMQPVTPPPSNKYAPFLYAGATLYTLFFLKNLTKNRNYNISGTILEKITEAYEYIEGKANSNIFTKTAVDVIKSPLDYLVYPTYAFAKNHTQASSSIIGGLSAFPILFSSRIITNLLLKSNFFNTYVVKEQLSNELKRYLIYYGSGCASLAAIPAVGYIVHSILEKAVLNSLLEKVDLKKHYYHGDLEHDELQFVNNIVNNTTADFAAKSALFFGEPGVGKSFRCVEIGKKLGSTKIYRLFTGRLADKYINGTAEKLLEVLKTVDSIAKNTDEKVVLIIEEVDSITATRSNESNIDKNDAKTTGVFLDEVERMLKENTNLTILSNSNRLKDIDGGALRRLGHFRKEVKTPTTEYRKQQLEGHLLKKKTKFNDNLIEFITQHTDGFPTNFLELIINHIVTYARHNNIETITMDHKEVIIGAILKELPNVQHGLDKVKSEITKSSETQEVKQGNLDAIHDRLTSLAKIEAELYKQLNIKYIVDMLNTLLRHNRTDNVTKKKCIDYFKDYRIRVSQTPEQVFLHKQLEALNNGKNSTEIQKITKEIHSYFDDQNTLSLTSLQIQINIIKEILKNLNENNTDLTTIKKLITELKKNQTYNIKKLEKIEKTQNKLFDKILSLEKITDNYIIYYKTKFNSLLLSKIQQRKELLTTSQDAVNIVDNKSFDIFEKQKLIIRILTPLQNQILLRDQYNIDNIMKKLNVDNPNIKDLDNAIKLIEGKDIEEEEEEEAVVVKDEIVINDNNNNNNQNNLDVINNNNIEINKNENLIIDINSISINNNTNTINNNNNNNNNHNDNNLAYGDIVLPDLQNNDENHVETTKMNDEKTFKVFALAKKIETSKAPQKNIFERGAQWIFSTLFSSKTNASVSYGGPSVKDETPVSAPQITLQKEENKPWYVEEVDDILNNETMFIQDKLNRLKELEKKHGKMFIKPLFSSASDPLPKKIDLSKTFSQDNNMMNHQANSEKNVLIKQKTFTTKTFEFPRNKLQQRVNSHRNMLLNNY